MARTVDHFLRQHGIDPYYLFTGIFLLFLFLERKEFENWKMLDGTRKFQLGTTVCAVVIGVIVSCLHLAGLI
jgi:hypothetical protein